jgi:hypothetical protein
MPALPGAFILLVCPVAPTRRRKAKEDEADGVSFTEFAFHPPSPCHQNKVMGDT